MLYAILDKKGVVVDLVSPADNQGLKDLDHLSKEQKDAAVKAPTDRHITPGWRYENGEFHPPGKAARAEKLSLADQARTLAAKGIEISSEDEPGLAGIYNMDLLTQGRMLINLTSIQLSGTFPSGDKTREWPDKDGTLHKFTTDQFEHFAWAAIQFADALDTIAQKNSGKLPTQPIDIDKLLDKKSSS